MKYFIVFLYVLIQAVCNAGELVIVQIVSSDKKSFVIAKGIKDGISVGQEQVFANENISLVCRANEVNRNFSYWQPVVENMTIPFLRDEIISSTSHIYGNVELDLVADQNRLIESLETTLKADQKTLNSLQDKVENRMRSLPILRGSLGTGITQSASSVSSSQNTNRSVYDFSAEYNIHFRPEFEIGIGARMDSDIYRIANVALDIPTARLLAIVDVTYHFLNWSSDRNNFYFSLLAGLGTSKTVINQSTTVGYATILPQMRIGYIMPFSKTTALLLETSIESITAKETLPDSTVQTSSFINLKATIGLTF